MSEQTSQEPTMEEILASIRRIISEDDTPAEEGATAAPAAEAAAEPEPASAAPAAAEPEPDPEPVAAAPEPEPEAPPEPVAVAAPEEDDDDLELTQKVETHGDLDILAPTDSEPPPPAASLVSDSVAAVAAASFDKLSATIAMPAHGRTLEDVVRELLRPMLQQWLDDNLPGIVQEAVQAEVERISRSRVR
jgi:cell pole-organizing protein PopZ